MSGYILRYKSSRAILGVYQFNTTIRNGSWTRLDSKAMKETIEQLNQSLDKKGLALELIPFIPNAFSDVAELKMMVEKDAG